MTKPFHWSHALTAIGLVTALTACSTGGTTQSASVAKVDPSKVGIATRAQAALAANDLITAVSLGEQAVEYRPQEASFRALLGNIYLASGRFASAEAAYKDTIALDASQAQIILKLALVQVALGKTEQASGLLESAQGMLDVADLGLALALAGRPDQAIAVLEPAARAQGADARTRQNLALAHALSGNWAAARTIAAQDLAAGEVDQRIDQWLAMSKPGQTGSQVAAFIGVTPAASDPGQPTRLALVAPASNVRLADVAPVASVAPVAAFVPPVVEPTPVALVPVEVAPVAVAELSAPYATPPIVQPRADAPVYVPPVPIAPRRVAVVRSPRPALSVAPAKFAAALPNFHRAALVRGSASRSRAVVQLGAYASRGFIAGAWSRAAGKYGVLRNFVPVTARFDGPRGTVYRLSVKGFASDRQAIDLCSLLKRAGGNCFVRATYNDAPIQLASR